jgi:hypothetical protein
MRGGGHGDLAALSSPWPPTRFLSRPSVTNRGYATINNYRCALHFARHHKTAIPPKAFHARYFASDSRRQDLHRHSNDTTRARLVTMP